MSHRRPNLKDEVHLLRDYPVSGFFIVLFMGSSGDFGAAPLYEHAPAGSTAACWSTNPLVGVTEKRAAVCSIKTWYRCVVALQLTARHEV